MSVTKEFVERKPVTWYAIAAKGRRALRAHLDGLGKLIAQAGKPARD